jgi:hypothetical protein
MFKKTLIVGLFIILFSQFPLTQVVFADAYNYDYWGQPRPTKDGYQVEKVYFGETIDLTMEADNQPIHVQHMTDFFVTDTHFYLVDRQNARVAKLNHQMSTIIVIDGTSPTEKFIEPRGIFVTPDNEIYITDYQREAIYVFDTDLIFQREIVIQESLIYGSRPFAVDKIVLDRTKRIYVTVGNVYDGIVELSNLGNFSRFYGVQEVSIRPIDVLWRRFMTQAQLEQTVLFLPVEYTNLSIDSSGFIYATATSNSRTPIQRLNPNGSDVLRHNGYVPPTGDAIRRSGNLLPNNFVAVTVNDFGVYSVLDSASRRIFTYNDQGYLIFITGEEGVGKGQFRTPSTIAYHGDQLIVGDSSQNTLTVFGLTPFGQKVTEVQRKTYLGNFEEVTFLWEAILEENPNFFYAYIGLGDELFRQRQYEKAMKFYQQGFDRLGYSKAYTQYRRQRLQNSFSFIGFSLSALVILTIVRPMVKDIRKLEE